jgi:Fe2+ transport system protein FeoA
MTVPHHHRLDELPAGTRAVVHHIESADDAVRRLMAMGLCVGRELEIVRHGNPLIVRLLGARVGVSGRVARHVVVERRS